MPAKVTGVATVSLGTTRVGVKWSARAGATTYRVVVKSGSHVVKKVVVKATNKRIVTIAGLKKSHSYRVTVQAHNAHGYGASSTVKTVKTKSTGGNVSATKVPSTVKKPTISTAKTSLRTNWKGASATGALGVSKYQIRVMKGSKVVAVLTVDDHLRSSVIKKLLRHTTYTVSVRAGSWAGWGHWSTGKTTKTH